VSVLQAAWLVFLKEVRVERRTGEIVTTTGLFAVLVAVLTALSFYVDRQSAMVVAPGVLWVAIAFSGILAVSRCWSREREMAVMRGLLLCPIPRAAIYLGKALGTLSFLIVVELLLAVVVGVLFHVDLVAVAGPLSALMLLGTVGFVAAANLFAAMGVRTRARDLLLSVTVFPIIAPALLCAVVATRELLHGAPFGEIAGWVQILAAFDIAFVTVGLLIFEPMTSD
jgi:heme exporter protein B